MGSGVAKSLSVLLLIVLSACHWQVDLLPVSHIGVSPESQLQQHSLVSTSLSHRDKPQECLKDALVQLGSSYPSNVRPALFSMKTSSFHAIFFAVPGDEKHWATNNRPWKGVTTTLIFVGELFRRAKERGFGTSATDPALIDVGANMGQEVVVAAQFGYTATTFELLPRSVKAIKFNQKANCIPDTMITVVNAGVSEESGEITINDGGFSASTSMQSSTKKSKKTNVPVWSLDDYFLHPQQGQFTTAGATLSTRPLLLKLDCEGCEVGAVKGALELLKKYPPHYIMIEYHKRDTQNAKSIEMIQKKFHYSRVYFIDKGDRKLNPDEVTAWEKEMLQSNRKWESFDPDIQKETISDIVLIHDDAFDIGLFSDNHSTN